MAKRRLSLAEAFEATDQEEVPSEETVKPAETSSEEEPKKTATKKTASAKKAAKKATPAKKGSSAKKSGGKSPRSRSTDNVPSWATDELRVLAASTKSAKAKNLYLHDDDNRALEMAKIEFGYGDFQARIRSMIALYRHDPKYRAAVEELARTAPRGGW